jgi:hypothetical protein
MKERQRILEHRAFIQKEKDKRKEKLQLVSFLNKQQEVLFGEVVDPMKEEELI